MDESQVRKDAIETAKRMVSLAPRVGPMTARELTKVAGWLIEDFHITDEEFFGGQDEQKRK